MSAYIVDNKIINRILSGIDYANMNNDSVSGIPRPYGETLKNSEPHELGQALRELNERAVKQRYPDWRETGLPGIYENGVLVPYKYEWETIPQMMQLYKDLACLIYQMSEGDAVNDPLFLELVDFYNVLAHAMVKRLPNYEKSTWGE